MSTNAIAQKRCFTQSHDIFTKFGTYKINLHFFLSNMRSKHVPIAFFAGQHLLLENMRFKKNHNVQITSQKDSIIKHPSMSKRYKTMANSKNNSQPVPPSIGHKLELPITDTFIFKSGTNLINFKSNFSKSNSIYKEWKI